MKLWDLVTKLSSGGVSTYTISGVVYDADGTTPVASATVALGAYSATSAANGTYTISDIPPDTSGSMTCTKTGYSWTAKTIAAMSANLTAQNYTNAWWAGGGSGASCVRAYRPKGAASLAASYINLANPGTGDASLGSAPAFTSGTGWDFSSGGKWLETGLTPESGWSWVLEFSDGNSGDVYPFGEYTLNAGMFFYIRIAGNVVRYGNGGVLEKNPVDTSGVFGAAGNKGYRNGVVETGTIGAWTASASYTINIGRRNQAAPDGNFLGKIQALAIYNTTLSEAQMAAIKGGLNP